MDEGDAKLRISDADRSHVTRLLEHAVGQGMLTLDEFTERMDQTLAARTRGELSEVVADLPGMDLLHPVAPVPAVAEQLRGRMSTVSRRGPWRVPARLALNTRMCDTTLDFSSAILQSASVVVDIDDYCSSTELILPDGATADLNGLETIAGSATLKVPHGPRSQRLHLEVRGKVRMGSLTARYAFGTAFRRMLAWH
ncbi:DUF1707 SHOCT-like domain-containing protein [Mycobacterium deserti]|uniref:DUF1707 domain-containing protein n=1 Tax=Mycobacterium deserti TaxID=2978347 RepID=A0ABT2M622_9MYCO|nr:DUF1707 domain-containing protein [Mycobacterium deserti]MCT7657704.1 DUF1707 domain-containing protein [Mycobacterium deserti]